MALSGAIVAWIALILALIVGALLPTILNAAGALYIARRVAKRWWLRVPIALGAAAVLGLNVRLFADAQDWLSPPGEETTVLRKTVLGPTEKVKLDFDREHFYYRRTSEPLSWGMRSDWSVGFGALPVIDQEPARILRNRQIAATTAGEQRVVLRLRATESLGRMSITAEVLDAAGVAAKFRQTVRKSYPFEEFNNYGIVEAGWRAVALYLTQSTLWNHSVELYPPQHDPLGRFVAQAISQQGASADGSAMAPLLDPLDRFEPIQAWLEPGSPFTDARARNDVPKTWAACYGKDRDWAYVVNNYGEVSWKDKDIPPLRLSLMKNGYRVSMSSVYCKGDEFWLASHDYSVNQINVWRYKVNFTERSLRLEEWLRADLPVEVFSAMGPWKLRGIVLGEQGGSSSTLYAAHFESRFPNVIIVEGYEMRLSRTKPR